MNKNSVYIFGIIVLFVAMLCSMGIATKWELKCALNDQESQAAKFLLKNSKHYYTTDNADLLAFYPYLDSLSLSDVTYHNEKKLLSDYFQQHKSARTCRIPDRRQLSASYLKSNIKSAFQFYGQSWNSHLSDSAFYEYVLPYRVGDEYLEDWRQFFLNKYGYILDSLKATNQLITTRLLANEILKVLKQREIKTLQTNVYSKTLRPTTLDKIKVGTCNDYSDYVNFVMRAFGIPCAKDGLFDWHCWNAVLTPDSTLDCYVECTFEDKHLDNWLFYVGWKNLPKIWRQTFSENPKSLAKICGNEPIPQFFRNACMVDVSKEYFKGADVDFNLRNNYTNQKYAYLKVWNNGFEFVDWSAIENGKCKFLNVSDSVVYFPSFFNGRNNLPADYPFVVTTKGRHSFVPNHEEKQQMVLYRKYFIKRAHNVFLKRMLDGYFVGANQPDFSDSTLICTISEMPKMYWNEIELKSSKKFKYIKYVSPIWSWLNVGEMEFYNAQGEKLLGEIIGTQNFSAEEYSTRNAFDGDVLTYVDAIEPHHAWLGLEFESPQQIAKIRYIPRNDDNFVQAGQLYELLYADSTGWQTMGVNYAKADSLIYDNVPSGAIYLLKNLTKGHEERIFEYKNGKQVFW